MSKKLKPAGMPIELHGTLPGEGAAKGSVVNSVVKASDGRNVRNIVLTKKLGQGGEGSVFETNLGEHSDYVAKIYHRDKLTTDRRDKLTLMVSRDVACEGVCFPVALILNECDEFVGYLMPKADGEELQKVVFNPMLLRKRHPDWTRHETILLCMTILNKIAYLNERNIILGDINPRNILVKSPADVYFVDCDSYQVEGYPCPAGTPHFTPPEAQGKDYKMFLRTQAMENFAIATLMFMIMLPGKSPYAAVGGADPAENIRKGEFPYEAKDSTKIPSGKWGFIWSQMSFNVRQAFAETFRKGGEYFEPETRLDANDWFKLFDMYQHGLEGMLKNDEQAADIFPTHLKKRECKKCKKKYIPGREYSPFCDECRRKYHAHSIPFHAVSTSGWTTCSRCGRPVRKDKYDRQGGICDVCISHKEQREAKKREEQREAKKREEQQIRREKWLGQIWKTYPCKNPKCHNTITLYNRDQNRQRLPEYCNECWQDTECTRCGYVAAKWMHDERGGLCRRCYEQEQKQKKLARQGNTPAVIRTGGVQDSSKTSKQKSDKNERKTDFGLIFGFLCFSLMLMGIFDSFGGAFGVLLSGIPATMSIRTLWKKGDLSTAGAIVCAGIWVFLAVSLLSAY